MSIWNEIVCSLLLSIGAPKDTGMVHRIHIDETLHIRVKAREFYSTEKINVVAGEEYRFSCDPEECWVDSIIPASPDGAFNLLALIAGMRVKHTKCFCLCGAYNDQEDGVFAIGANNQLPMTKTGTLSFFANDTKGYYNNNKGVITVHVTRIK